MTTPVKVSADIIAKIMVLLSILFLLRGHNQPGGGFVGALIGTAAIGLYTLAHNLRAKQFTRYVPRLLAIGMLCFILSLGSSITLWQPPLQGLWYQFSLAGKKIKLGTPLLFDIGVYCLVLGSLSWLIAELKEKA